MCLLCVLVCMLSFAYRDERLPLLHIVEMSFPCLQNLMSSILENNSIEAAHVLRICLKVFWSCTQYKLPIVAGVDVNLWFHVLSTLLNKRLPEASEGLEPADQPTDIEERNAWPWWKVSVLA
jgi:importin-7